MNECENPVIETVVNNTIVVVEDDCSVITTNTDSPINIISDLTPGPPGAAGKSAYALALDDGFTGTLTEWLQSLSQGIAINPSDADKFLTNDGSSASWRVVSAFTVGLGSVDNTSDLNKPISTATQAELNKKLNITDFDTTLTTSLNSVPRVIDQGSL